MLGKIACICNACAETRCTQQHPGGKSPRHLNECPLVISLPPAPPAPRFQAAAPGHQSRPPARPRWNATSRISAAESRHLLLGTHSPCSCFLPVLFLLPGVSSLASPSPSSPAPQPHRLLLTYLLNTSLSWGLSPLLTFFLGKPALTVPAGSFFPMTFMIK